MRFTKNVHVIHTPYDSIPHKRWQGTATEALPQAAASLVGKLLLQKQNSVTNKKLVQEHYAHYDFFFGEQEDEKQQIEKCSSQQNKQPFRSLHEKLQKHFLI